MKQTFAKTVTYSSDEFGVCSALYELGGMVVMHDASGCNSTYTTHDEPRWYDMDSQIYISALSQREAILGDDDKFMNDIMETAGKLKPEFVALVGAPIPYMIGTDFRGIAKVLEKRLQIPCFGFYENGMQYYTKGIYDALKCITERYCTERNEKEHEKPVVNICGATPLDLSLNGTVEKIREWLTSNGFEPGVCFCMGDDLEVLKKAADADVNLVVAYGGFGAADVLKERFGIPAVAGIPFGKTYAKQLAQELKNAVKQEGTSAGTMSQEEHGTEGKKCILIGEQIQITSLAKALMSETDLHIKALCPLDIRKEELPEYARSAPEEDDLIRELKDADLVIADPMYRVLCPESEFIQLPHIALSGRIYEKEIPNLIGASVRDYILERIETGDR